MATKDALQMLRSTRAGGSLGYGRSLFLTTGCLSCCWWSSAESRFRYVAVLTSRVVGQRLNAADVQSFTALSLSALVTTANDESAMAAPASIGDSRMPATG